MIVYSVGLSIFVSLLFTEVVGLYTGGLISSGYLALFLHQPVRLATTFGAALATFGIIRLLSEWMLIYGRRRFAAAVLIGYLAGAAFSFFAADSFGADQDMRVIGYIIPGLIANDMHRQGVFKTILCLAAVAAMVRLLLLLLF